LAKNDLYDAVVIGAGLYGLYSALFLGKQGMKVLVLEADERPFMRATYINQARAYGVSLSKIIVYCRKVRALL